MAGNWYDDLWSGIGDFFEETEPPPLDDILFGDPGTMDPYAQDLMWRGVVEKDDSAYLDLVEYMWDKYGIDFEDAWDWVDFKEWYDSQ